MISLASQPLNSIVSVWESSLQRFVSAMSAIALEACAMSRKLMQYAFLVTYMHSIDNSFNAVCSHAYKIKRKSLGSRD